MNKINNYINNDVNNPKYLFHGSPTKMLILEPTLSHDSNNNIHNIDSAIFLSSSFLGSTPYAFKDQIKELSKNFFWKFDISYNNKLPIMTLENCIIDENIIGYIYIFNYNEYFKNDPIGSTQYKSYKNILPIDIIEIKYKDFKKYYNEINCKTCNKGKNK